MDKIEDLLASFWALMAAVFGHLLLLTLPIWSVLAVLDSWGFLW